jgi:type I restriction enzyme S subunit
MKTITKDKAEQKPGYKHTRLGWIPEDWKISRFDEIFQFIPTYSFSRKELSKNQPNDNDVFNIHYGDIHTSFHNEQLDFDKNLEVASLVDSTIDVEKFKLLQEGDLVIADASEDYEGICDSVELKNVKNRKIIGGLHTFAVRDKSGLTSNGFRGFIFKNEIVKHNIKRVATGISVLGVSKSNISKILIPLPPVAEQIVISKALLKWETAITKLNALIKAKQKRKKGLMQQLLSGKKRLPGFDGEWETKRIEDIANEHSQKNGKGEDIEVLSCTKYDGLVPSLQYFGRQVFGENLSSYKVVPRGYYAYATNHIEEGSIGYQNIINVGLVSPMYTVFKTDESIHDDFFFRVLKSHRLIHEYNRHMEGSINRRGGLRWKNFKRIKVTIPEYEEQAVISQVLDIADKEIELLQQQLSQLKQQKEGMMQELLTGRKRLKE